VRVEFDDRLTPAAPVIVVAEAGLIIARTGISEEVLLRDVSDVAPELDLCSVRAAYEGARVDAISTAELAIDAPTTPLATPEPALAAAGAAPSPGLSAPIVYRRGDDTWPTIPPVRFAAGQIAAQGNESPLARQRMRHHPWRALTPAMWAVATIAVVLIARMVLAAPADAPTRSPSGTQAPGQSTSTIRGRRAPGHEVAARGGRDAAATPTAPGTPTPRSSASPTASASAPASAPPQPSGGAEGSGPALDPTVPDTPSPSTSQPAPPPETVPASDPPPSPSASDAPPGAPVVVTVCDPTLGLPCPPPS